MNFDNYNLDTPLIELLSGSDRSSFRVRHALEGVQIFGANGSGKTSGSGHMIALKYLMAGFGGLVLTAKPLEKEMWQDYCRMTGRTDDLLIIEPRGRHTFNFIAYEASQVAGGETLTDNLVDLLKTVIRAGQTQGGGRTDDQFWESSLDMLIYHIIDLSKLAYGSDSITLKNIFEIAQSIPKSIDEVRVGPDEKPKAFHRAVELARSHVNVKIHDWFCKFSQVEQENLEQNEWIFEAEAMAAIPDARLLKQVDQFFIDNYISLSDKTRSVIDISLTGFLFRLMRDPVYSLFCRGSSTLTPEASLDGKIILLNLPIKKYHKVGRDTQIMFKLIWQRAMEKRDVKKHPRPVFLWADEAHSFIHEKDTDFQATARSSRVATVYLSQNLPNYYASMGGDRAEYRVKGFLGTMGTKIFNANADMDTNRYASEIIGDGYYVDRSKSTTMSESFSHTKGESRKLERIVRPEQFVSLRCGGPMNDCMVEAYLHRQGDSIMDGQNHIKMRFNQNYQPNIKR